MSFATLRHFVPTFLLRYFEAVEEGVQRPVSPSSARSRESHDDAGINVYRLDQGKLVLNADPESIAPSRTRLDDLDIDSAHDSLRTLERSVTQLETDALGVVRTLVYAVSKDKPNVQVTRRQLNTLHRYLFLMWCRHTDRALQLTSSNVDAKTRQALEVHTARNFGGKPAQPLDVWLQNLRQILDDKFVDIFSDEKIFLQDRQAFEQDCRQGRLALWRSAPDMDFISSANAFAIYDGWPVDSGAGVSAQATLLSLQHDNRAMFAHVKVFPMHPNLALAILDPTLAGGANPGAHYDTLLSRGSSQFVGFPAYAPDIRYAGLSPAARKAQRTGDSKTLENGGRKFAAVNAPAGKRIDGRLLEAREDDMYTLTPASLTARQTLLVNSLVLHCASGALIFRSPRQLHHALGAYARDFTTWSPKQDYSRLQDLLRRHETGQPLLPDIEPLALMAPPLPPVLEPLDRPSTPTSPPMSPGRKSRRQKRREWMDRKLARQSLGLASPPLSSPATSDAELPDEDIASPMSDPATLVDSPIMPSIEAAMGSPLIKPFVLDDQPLDEQTHEPEIILRHTHEDESPLNIEQPEKVEQPYEVTENENVYDQDIQEVPEGEGEKLIDVDIIESLPASESTFSNVFADDAPVLVEEALYLPPSRPISEISDGDREVALATTEASPIAQVAVLVTEISEQVPHTHDSVVKESDQVETAMSYASIVEKVELVVAPEDPFDDSHEVPDVEAGRHALAVDAALNGMHAHSVSEVELESFGDNVHEEYDAASMIEVVPDPATPGLVTFTDVGSNSRDIDDEEDQSSASHSSTPKRSRPIVSADDETTNEWRDESHGMLLPATEPLLADGNLLGVHEITPAVIVTPATPAIPVVLDIDEKQSPALTEERKTNETESLAATELRKRSGIPAVMQDTKERAAPSQPLAHYTLSKTIIVWMVLGFLLMFAFPYILLRTISAMFLGRKSVEAAVQEARSTVNHD